MKSLFILMLFVSCTKNEIQDTIDFSGPWGTKDGGEMIQMWVQDDGIKIDFSCAIAGVTGDHTQSSPVFSAEGVYIKQHGTIYEGHNGSSDEHKAKFDFTISDEKVEIIITDIATNNQLSACTLFKGIQKVVAKCP